ncbi:hypothetical protein CF336_g7752 [Tilletia laevis]|nr:hypothetical protein CF336_g7752 [Tilletia laevis]
MDDSTASAPAAFERLHLDLRGTRFTIERDDLMNLPESVLLCLFPNGLALNNTAAHGRHLGYSSADEDEEEEEDEEDVYIVDFDPACLSYVLAFFKTAQDAFYGTETLQGKFRGGPQAAARLSAYLQSQNAAATSEFGGVDGFGAQSGWANQNPLLTKQAVIVLREELEYFAIPPHSTQEAASAVAAGGEAEETRLAKEADGQEHVLASDALGRLKRDAGRALLERRSIFTALQRNVNKENNMAEQHLIDMLCMSGFEPNDTWGFRAVEPARCSLTSISLVLLKTGITHSAGAEGTEEDDQDDNDDENDRSGAEILADMRIDQTQLSTAQKLLLFWRKPARKCWWDGVDVVVPLPLGASAGNASQTTATAEAKSGQTPETVAAAAAAQTDPGMTGISEAELDLLANGRGRKVLTRSLALARSSPLPVPRRTESFTIMSSETTPLLNSRGLPVNAADSNHSLPMHRSSHSSAPNFAKSFWWLFTSSWLNVLMVFIPLGFLAEHLHWGALMIFVFNFLAIVPLAKLLGDCTEQVSIKLGPTLGALANATFGNAVELIVAIVALTQGQLRIVQTSLIGSILSNILLVLGMSFIAGGLYRSESVFQQTAAQASGSIMTLGCITVVIPAAYQGARRFAAVMEGGHEALRVLKGKEDAGIEEGLLFISRGTAIVLLVIYLLYLVFQIRTHSHLFEAIPNEDDEEEAETPKMSPIASIVGLLLVTVITSFNADYLVGAIDEVAKNYGIPKAFIGIVLLPIVGNAAEHVTAVVMAYKGKMEIAVGVAVGSSIQIAVGVIPALVIVSWAIGQPLTLYFHSFETVVLVASVILVNELIQDGKSNYLEGCALVGLYIVAALAFWQQ